MICTHAELAAIQSATKEQERPLCLFCGQPEQAELLEVWSSREFMLDTCCEGMRKATADFLCQEPKAAARWLNAEGLANLSRGGARRVIEDGRGGILIDWNLQVTRVEQARAKAFVRKHHRHCPPPAGWRFGAAISNGPGEAGVIGVVMVGRPVAKAFDPAKVVEVNRLCIDDTIAEGLQWNACSLAYGWAAREAKRRGFNRIITYTLASEPGTSLRAAGWVPESRVRGRSWNTPSRPRQDRMEIVDKIRWSRTLVKGGSEAAAVECAAGRQVDRKEAAVRRRAS